MSKKLTADVWSNCKGNPSACMTQKDKIIEGDSITRMPKNVMLNYKHSSEQSNKIPHKV